MTRTYATLEVPAVIYSAMRAILKAADGRELKAGEPIDMHGIALVGLPGKNEGSIVMSSMVSNATGRGMVEIAVDEKVIQIDVAKARELHRILGEVIEAAISDEVLDKFLEQLGFDKRRKAQAMSIFREMRQGSADVVNPS